MALGKQTSRAKKVSLNLALVGIMAATVECGKLALAFIPNVEVVTLFLALFSYVFGITGVIAAVIFVCIEPFIWGFGTWLVSYLIYWPCVALTFFFLGRIKIKNRFLTSSIVALLTFLFGILTSLIDIGLLSGFFDNFWYRFGVYYTSGVTFYAVHIASNTVIFFFLFGLLLKRLEKIKKSILGLM